MPTLLEICTEAMDDMGSFVVPSFLFTNVDDTAKQLIALAKKIGREMMRDHDFQELDASETITTQANVSKYDLPADYDRLISNTTWDQALNRRMHGQTTPQQWSAITNRLVQVSLSHFWRIRKSQIEVYPVPTPVFTFDFEYKSAFYCKSADGTAKREWTADNDVPVLPYDLFIAGIRYYFSKANNLAYEDAQDEYNAIIARRESTNKPAATINLSAGVQRIGSRYTPPMNFPDKVTV